MALQDQVSLLSSKADFFSAWLSISRENHSLNSSCESNMVGMMKCRRAHNYVRRKENEKVVQVPTTRQQ